MADTGKLLLMGTPDRGTKRELLLFVFISEWDLTSQLPWSITSKGASRLRSFLCRGKRGGD